MLRVFEDDLFKRYLSKHADIVDTIITEAYINNLDRSYNDRELEELLSRLGLNHDDIYQDGILPPDDADLTTPQNRGIIASEKETISIATLNAKDTLIDNVFHPARENAQFQPSDDE